MMESQNMMGAFKIAKTLCANPWNETNEPDANKNKPQIQRESKKWGLDMKCHVRLQCKNCSCCVDMIFTFKWNFYPMLIENFT
jgi:hypothetical protein